MLHIVHICFILASILLPSIRRRKLCFFYLCLFVRLSVGYLVVNERILMAWCGEVRRGPRSNWLVSACCEWFWCLPPYAFLYSVCSCCV